MLLAPMGLKGHSPCSLITPNGGSYLPQPFTPSLFLLLHLFFLFAGLHAVTETKKDCRIIVSIKLSWWRFLHRLFLQDDSWRYHFTTYDLYKESFIYIFKCRPFWCFSGNKHNKWLISHAELLVTYIIYYGSSPLTTYHAHYQSYQLLPNIPYPSQQSLPQ